MELASLRCSIKEKVFRGSPEVHVVFVQSSWVRTRLHMQRQDLPKLTRKVRIKEELAVLMEF